MSFEEMEGTMKKKLYEFSAMLTCNIVIAANNEKEARKEIKTYKTTWYEFGDFIGVSDVELVDVRDTNNPKDEAHFVV
jgi:hypothetical protein